MTVKGKNQPTAAVRQHLRLRLESISALLRDIEAVTTGSGIPLANADVSEKIQKIAGMFGGGRSRRGFSIIHQAITAVDQNRSPKVVADWVASRLCLFMRLLRTRPLVGMRFIPVGRASRFLIRGIDFDSI